MRAQWIKTVTVMLTLGLLAACDNEGMIPFADKGEPTGAFTGPTMVVIEGASSLALGFDSHQEVRARVLQVVDATPVAGRAVRWALEGASSGNRLVLTQGLSDEQGRVAVELWTGSQREQFRLRVQVTGSESEPAANAWVDVSVDGVLTGSLEVRFAGTDELPLQQVTTRVHAGERDCATIGDGYLPPLADHVSPAELVAPSPAAALRFAGLYEQGVYTITADAAGPSGVVLARGCAHTPAIVAGALTSMTVALEPVAPSLSGRYSVGTELDLGDALPGPAATAVAEAEAFFSDPAGVLAERAVAQLGLDPVWGEALAPLLEEYILQRLPDWASDALLIGGDLTGLLTQLRVGGQLRIDDDADEHLAGHVEWTDFLWQWRAGECELGDACCGRTIYSGAEMGLAPIGTDLTGSWKRARDFSAGLRYDIVLDDHRLDLQYGALVLFALEQFVVPALSGQDTLECAVEGLIGCDAGGSFACGELNGSGGTALCGCARAGQWLTDQVGQPRTLTEAACTRAIGNLAGELRQRLRAMAFEGSDATHVLLSLSGEAIDEGIDLQSDTFALSGAATLVVNEAQYPASAVVNADLERASCSANGDCGSGQACRLRTGLLDDCAASLRCADVIGDRYGVHGCSLDRQCGSGLCLAGGRCFEACADAESCSADLACRAAEVTLASGALVSVGACQP